MEHQQRKTLQICDQDFNCAEHEAHVKKLLENAEYNDAIVEITRKIASIVYDPKYINCYFQTKSYDDLIIKIAGLLPNFKLEQDPKPVAARPVILVTELYETGGHTRIVKTLTQIFPEALVISTNYFEGIRPTENPQSINKDVFFLSIPHGPPSEKIVLLTKICRQISSRLFLVTHHHDIVAIAAAIRTGLPTYFLIHSEHRLSLGHTISQFHHIALVPESHSIHFPERFVKIPQGVEDLGVKTAPASTINTCTSGGFDKFYWDSEVSLPLIISRLLKEVSTNHYHIGELPPNAKLEITKSIINDRIALSRFKHIEFTPSLWKTILNSDINIYVDSTRVSGIRTCIEVQGAGVPVLPYVSGLTNNLTSLYHANHEIGWSTISELIYKLKHIWKSYDYFSMYARDYYLKNFRLDRMQIRLHELMDETWLKSGSEHQNRK